MNEREKAGDILDKTLIEWASNNGVTLFHAQPRSVLIDAAIEYAGEHKQNRDLAETIMQKHIDKYYSHEGISKSDSIKEYVIVNAIIEYKRKIEGYE